MKIEREFGGNTVSRVDIGIEGLIAAENAGGFASPISEAYRKWSDLAFKGVPTAEDFPVSDFPSLSHYTVDVSCENPEGYRFNFISLGAEGSDRHRQLMATLSNSVVAEHPMEDIRADMMAEYTLCKYSNEPSAYRLSHTIDGFTRDYARLLLPVCDRQGNVSALVGLSRHLEAPSG
jgi:hypothetical protein